MNIWPSGFNHHAYYYHCVRHSGIPSSPAPIAIRACVRRVAILYLKDWALLRCILLSIMRCALSILEKLLNPCVGANSYKMSNESGKRRGIPDPRTFTVVSIPLTATKGRCGWPSTILTTEPSPSYIPCIAPVFLRHMKKFPSSEPEVTNSSLGPKKFTAGYIH